METKEIGRMIYTLRLRKGISQEELGERRPDILVFNGRKNIKKGYCRDKARALQGRTPGARPSLAE